MISSPLTIISPLHFPSSPFFLGTHYSSVYFYFCKSKSAKLKAEVQKRPQSEWMGE